MAISIHWKQAWRPLSRFFLVSGSEVTAFNVTIVMHLLMPVWTNLSWTTVHNISCCFQAPFHFWLISEQAISSFALYIWFWELHFCAACKSSRPFCVASSSAIWTRSFLSWLRWVLCLHVLILIKAGNTSVWDILRALPVLFSSKLLENWWMVPQCPAKLQTKF